ncbi:MAG: VanZ family protein [Candidatus Saccharibacteria bacterium]|nr:VanZ family protein [Rhodoferax sp.]
MLGNVLLFAPLGLITMLNWVPAWGLLRAAISSVVIGFLMALGLQVLQIFLPSRDAALADVAWNMLGMVGGALAGSYIASKKPGLAALSPDKFMPLCLLGGLIAIEWLPLIPSLDLALVKTNLKLISSTPVAFTAPLWQGIAVAMLAGYLLAEVINLRHSTFWLALLLTVIGLGKLFIEDMPAQPSAQAGLAFGGMGWAMTGQFAKAKRRTIVWLLLILCYTASALQPFEFRDVAAAISWLPFAAMLEGSMVHNVQSLAGNLVFYVSILYVGASASGRLAPATLGLTLWVVVMELMQTLIIGRNSDITEPILVLLVGQTLARFPSHGARLSKASDAAVLLDQSGQPVGLTAWLFRTAIASSFIMFGSKVLLSLPGIPYNVRELFRADANLPALFAFSMALLWAGGGSVWLGTRLNQARWPAFQLFPLTLLVSVISLTWLWAGVTTESIEDISGSSNRFWFVTEHGVWGPVWKDAFLWVNSPDWISILEHYVRYSALYAPLPIALGVLIALRQSARQGGWRVLRLGSLLLVAGALLWLCKAIAFDWSSTDNLNELIASDGEWGWGGGGFLYVLLMVICFDGLLLAEAVSGGFHQISLAVLFSLVALPVGWWLLNQGLEQNVQKYELVYSGTQFLLGQDRSHQLSQTSLFLRWCITQLSATLVLATGVWLGQSAPHKNSLRTLRWHHATSIHKKAT